MWYKLLFVFLSQFETIIIPINQNQELSIDWNYKKIAHKFNSYLRVMTFDN